jgi:exopolysaccharide production protein ExoY
MWLAPAFRDLLTTGMEVHQRGSLPLLSVTGPRITGLEAAFKRGLDIGLVVATLPVTLILSLGIAVWLAAVQHVAPLASHRVIGRNRREFTLLTFAPTPALQHVHLWRLPALLNVLIGELSLVGPRPIARSFGSEYRPWSLMLASVRPGLTGPWWLLSGSVGSRSVETEVSLDLAYIRSYTIWLDVRLLALTARHLLAHSGKTHTSVIPAELSRIATPDPTGVRIGGLL